MSRNFFYILLFIIAYAGLKFWRIQQKLKKQEEKNKNLNAPQNSQSPINWDAQDVEYEEIKDSKE